MDELICSICKGKIINAHLIGWTHEEGKNCSLIDGLTRSEIEENSGIYEVYVKDLLARKFFLKKIDEILGKNPTLSGLQPTEQKPQIPPLIESQPQFNSAIRHKKLGDLEI